MVSITFFVPAVQWKEHQPDVPPHVQHSRHGRRGDTDVCCRSLPGYVTLHTHATFTHYVSSLSLFLVHHILEQYSLYLYIVHLYSAVGFIFTRSI